MGIASDITRLQGAKTDIAAAIDAKGVTVPEGTKMDGFAALIAEILTGGDLSNYASTITVEMPTVSLDRSIT